ncbi:MAG: hypothetical protein R3F11_08915 [Verrucomicrobiales bacterium]
MGAEANWQVARSRPEAWAKFTGSSYGLRDGCAFGRKRSDTTERKKRSINAVFAVTVIRRKRTQALLLSAFCLILNFNAIRERRFQTVSDRPPLRIPVSFCLSGQTHDENVKAGYSKTGYEGGA